MNYSIISTALILICGVFIVASALLGLWRGWAKSTIRIGVVLLVSILTLFLTPYITKSLMSIDLSGLNINIEGVTITKISSLMVILLGNYGLDEATLNSMPTVKDLCNNLPLMVINVVVYLLFFVVLMIVGYFIYLILSAIILPKRKRTVMKKRRWIGFGVGALQGLVVFAVFLMPTLGLMNVADNFLAELKPAPKAESVASIGCEDFTISNVAFAEMDAVYVADDFNFDKTTDTMKKIIYEYKNCFVIKTMSALGYSKVSDWAYDNLTTVKINGENVTLRNETNNIAQIVNTIQKFGKINGDLTDAQIEDLKTVINKVFESKIMGGVISEVVPVVATKWSNSEKLIVEKPVVAENVEPLLDSVYKAFSTSNKQTIKADLLAFVDVVKVANDYKIISALTSNENVDILELVNQEGFANNVINELLKSRTIKEIFPSALDFGLQELYKVINIENASSYKITKKSSDLTEEQWTEERQVLADLIENMISVVRDLKNVENVNIDNINISAIGNVFNLMKRSQFLGANSKNVAVGILRSDLVGGAIPAEFINTVESKWNNIDFVATFNVVKASMDISKTTEAGTISTETMKTLLENMQDETVSEIVTEIASTENLKSMGVDEKTANALNEVVNNVTDAMKTTENVDYEKEAKAMETLMDAYGVIGANEPSNIVTAENVDDIVNSLVESDIILDAITANTEAGSITETIQNNITPEQQDLVNAQLTEIANGESVDEETQAKLEQIATLFGTGWTYPNP